INSRRDYTKEKNENYVSLQSRCFSEEKSDPPSNKLPELIPDFAKIVWPSLFKSIRNFLLMTFIIKPYLDREFRLQDFVSGSKKAVEAKYETTSGLVKQLCKCSISNSIPGAR
ncbi:hypothetical protein NQ317_015065, partial [Molorchus minor]